MRHPAGPFAIYGLGQPGAKLVLSGLKKIILAQVDPKSPRCISMRSRQTEGFLSGHSVQRRLAISLAIAGGLLLLAGCGGVASGSSSTAPVGTLSPSPSQVTFGSTKVGSNQTSTVTLSNSGGTALTITKATLSGAGFSMSNLALPLTLNAGNAASATITFAPTGSGNFSGSVTFATTANQVNSTVVVPFSGEGVAPGALSPNPSSLAFGSIQVGGSSSQSETLTNTGGSSLTISAATVSGTGFSLNGLTLPVTLTAGQSTSFTVLFSSDRERRRQWQREHYFQRL